MNALDLLDIVALATTTLYIGDMLRVVDCRSHPFLSIAFALIAIGAFVDVAYDLSGGAVHWWDVAVDIGIAFYVVMLHQREAHMIERPHRLHIAK